MTMNDYFDYGGSNGTFSYATYLDEWNKLWRENAEEMGPITLVPTAMQEAPTEKITKYKLKHK